MIDCLSPLPHRTHHWGWDVGRYFRCHPIVLSDGWLSEQSDDLKAQFLYKGQAGSSSELQLHYVLRGFSPPPTQDLVAGVFEAPARGSGAASQASGSPRLPPLLELKHRLAIISPVNPALGLFPAVTVWEPAPCWHCHMSAKLILAILIKKWLKQSVYLNGSVFYLCYSWILDSY